MTEEVGLLQRVATRLSLRKVKKEEVVKEEKLGKEEENAGKEGEEAKNGQEESVLHNDTKVGGEEPANEVSTDPGKMSDNGKKKQKKEGKEKSKSESVADDKKEEDEGIIQRLKSRLSVRGKKSESVNHSQQKESKDVKEDEKTAQKKEKEEVVEEKVLEEKKWVCGSHEEKLGEEGSKGTEKEEKKKSDNAFLRMLRKLSFRKKKDKKENVDNDDQGTKAEVINDTSKAELSEKKFEERETRPQSLVISPGRPPPGPGRPPIHPRTTTPSSATANVSRPVSDLDSALRQFKLSTAESRESLRTLGSRQDLTQVEERVREAVGKNLSRQGSLRRGTNGTTSIPITLSISLQELRAKE